MTTSFEIKWTGCTAYVGKLEVGRIQRLAPVGHPEGVFVEMLGQFGLSPCGDVSDIITALGKGTAMVEDNWKDIVAKMQDKS